MIYRSFAPDLDIRGRSSGGDGRTVYGIAVPWDVVQRITSTLTEVWRRGAFDHQLVAGAMERVKFSREHIDLGGQLIGRASLLRNDQRGLYGEWRVARTPAGDETLALLEAGALDELSAGVNLRQNRVLGGGVVERLKADLMEVAVVLQGAFGQQAVAQGVRAAVEPDSPATPNLDQARALLERLPRLPATRGRW